MHAGAKGGANGCPPATLRAHSVTLKMLLQHIEEGVPLTPDELACVRAGHEAKGALRQAHVPLSAEARQASAIGRTDKSQRCGNCGLPGHKAGSCTADKNLAYARLSKNARGKLPPDYVPPPN